MPLIAINPATDAVIREYQEIPPRVAAEVVDHSHRAFLAWRQTGFEERSQVMRSAARILRERASDYARLMAEEMGKPITQGKAECEKCAWVCDYYAEHAKAFLAPETVETDASKSYVTFKPLGVVLAVMPWNFPFWQVFRFAVPALMAGNVGILKHASNVPGCALAIEDIFRQAGLPANVFRTLLIGSKQVAAIIEHPGVQAVTLTGSTPAGRAVAKKAGSVLKKTVLELGGSDPYVILSDADVEAAVGTCVASRLINSGQSCINAKRFVVVASQRERFEQLLVEQMKAVKMGDPLTPETEVGPQARSELRDELHEQVERSIDEGARCLLGGYIPDGPGSFYPPTVLTDVRKGMPAFDEELFGPVAAIIAVPDDDAAIHVANDSSFGLGAAVFTADVRRGEEIAADRLEA
ncbi:MAG: succinate-semialdehyde dehydrogenase, partial [Gemmatimonas sp. SG8_17]